MRNTVKTAQTRRGIGWTCLFGLVLASVAALMADEKKVEKKKAAPKPTLEAALQEKAKTIRDFLLKNVDHPKESLHVGVLKFLVQIGKEPARDNVGPLNLHIADRLEAALILSLDEKDAKKILIIHNPSVSVLMKANHLTEAGRKAFFRTRYTPAWGEEKKITADAFLTGLVKIEDGGRTAEITVQAFNKKGDKLVEVCPPFKVAGDTSLLTEAGVSFALPRGEDADRVAMAWEGREEVPTEATTSVVYEGRKVTPAELLEQAPIDFQILYNDKPVEVSDEGRVREPTKKDMVTFRLKHKNLDDNTYGVVLRINGKSTIKPDNPETDDYLHYKWILKPKTEFVIRGFQTELEGKAHAFEVLPSAESREQEVSYGPNAGLFTVAIFKGRRDGKESRLVRANDDSLVIGRGVPNRLARSNNLQALQGELRKKTQADEKLVDRGIITLGKRTEQEVETIEFKTYRNPLSVIQIRYYKPRNDG